MNGKEAITMIEEKQNHDSDDCSCWYDLVLMDCNMPLMDGFTATALLKDMELDRKLIPSTIIACTGGVTEQEQNRC